MARAPLATLRREDFRDLASPDALDRFFRLLNTFMRQVQAGFSDLVLGENLRGGYVDLSFAGGAVPLRFKSPCAAPRAVSVAQAFDVTTANPVPVALAVAPAWTTSGADLVISDLGTLDAAKRYRVVFRIEG